MRRSYCSALSLFFCAFLITNVSIGQTFDNVGVLEVDGLTVDTFHEINSALNSKNIKIEYACVPAGIIAVDIKDLQKTESICNKLLSKPVIFNADLKLAEAEKRCANYRVVPNQ